MHKHIRKGAPPTVVTGSIALTYHIVGNTYPGETTKCSRSLAHTGADGNCTTCHGTMAEVASAVASGQRIPWVDEPKCSKCHDAAVPEVDTGTTLYRNAKGHGGIRCAACHGSPHAMVPSREASDNAQVIALQGQARSLGSCGACHASSKGKGSGEFGEVHGGANPETKSACHVCHTAVMGGTSQWPHGYQWKARNTGLTDPDGD